jgi:hypothetical protein
MTDDNDTVELRLARAYRDEGDKLRKQAGADLEAARYEHAQAERSLREIQVLQKSIAQREQRLVELGEPKLIEREKAAEAKLKEAQAVMKDYNATRHGAARAIVEINAREKAEREQSAA